MGPPTVFGGEPGCRKQVLLDGDLAFVLRGWYMEERRKFFRFNGPMVVRYGAPENGVEGLSLSKDFSREGIGLPVRGKLAKGDSLGLEINIPGEIIPIFAIAQVVWMNWGEGRLNCGLRFTRISPFDKSRILEYVYEEWVTTLRLRCGG